MFFTSSIRLCVCMVYACPFCAGMLATVTQADYNDDGDDDQHDDDEDES